MLSNVGRQEKPARNKKVFCVTTLSVHLFVGRLRVLISLFLALYSAWIWADPSNGHPLGNRLQSQEITEGYGYRKSDLGGFPPLASMTFMCSRGGPSNCPSDGLQTVIGCIAVSGCHLTKTNAWLVRSTSALPCHAQSYGHAF